MQLRLPGIAVQRFARVFSAGEINSNCRKIRLIKNSGRPSNSVARVHAARVHPALQHGYQYVSSL
ncbi:hypothetical protein EC40967_4425 [Escherichia coli 4.0967]|uniref:Uncharacterized protein n=1 Tax=Escherichia coli 4.0967 TaxID=869687 RepID=A0AAN3VA99_ECOLX|nr:hypothetical protein EC40967_4425 [Escherichia coli 4.0967]